MEMGGGSKCAAALSVLVRCLPRHHCPAQLSLVRVLLSDDIGFPISAGRLEHPFHPHMLLPCSLQPHYLRSPVAVAQSPLCRFV